MLAGYNLRQIPHHFGVQPKTDPLRCDLLLCNPGRSFVIVTQCIYILQLGAFYLPTFAEIHFLSSVHCKIVHTVYFQLSLAFLQ